MEGHFFVPTDRRPSTTSSSFEFEPQTGSLAYRDFCPIFRRKTDGWFFEAEYENTSQVLARANEWIKNNLKWEVVGCESISFDDSSGFLVTGTSHVNQNKLKRNLRVLRFWLKPRLHQTVQPLPIKCINVVPRMKAQVLISADTSSRKLPEFESLSEMMSRVNELLQNKPINGQLLSVETLTAPIEGNWIIDTDRCTILSDEEQCKRSFVHFIRLYYEFGNQRNERLELIDFVPECERYGKPLGVTNYEPFSSLMRRASRYLQNQPGSRFISATIVDVPLPSNDNHESEAFNVKLSDDQCGESNPNDAFNNLANGNNHHVHSSDAQKTTTSVDSCRTFFPPMSSEFSLKFIRLAFARPAEFGPEKFFPITREPIVLNCKVFVPATIVSPTSQNVYDFRYEDLSSLKRKMSAWLQTTGVTILGSTTYAVRLPYAASSLVTAIDSVITAHSTYSGHWLMAYYVFIDGTFIEPPASLLPDEEQASIVSSNYQTVCSIQ